MLWHTIAMHDSPLQWQVILLLLLKFLKTFGIIPGVLAAFWFRRLFQKWRQGRAMEGWPSTQATIQWGKTHNEGPRSIWAEITYSYFVGEYRSGTYVRFFRREEQADEFIRQLKDKQVQVHYKESDPDTSTLLDRDLEMLASISFQSH
jgi:hypothetical protein